MPSLRRPELVKSFAQRLAAHLGLPYHEAIKKKKDTPQQKTMENSFYQSSNALDGFEVKGQILNDPVLLVDDMIDSGWTITVCSVLLRRAGSGDVYPFALASTSKLS